MNGPFGNGFPYTNFHDLNLDWMIKEVKEFLDNKSSVLQEISDAKTDAVDTIATDKADAVDTIAIDKAAALQAITNKKNTELEAFTSAAERVGNEVIASIPSDYTTLSHNAIKVSTLIAGAYDSEEGIETIDSPVANNLYRLQLTSKPSWFPDTYPTNAQMLYLLDVSYAYSGTETVYRYIFDELLQVRYRMWKQPFGTWSAWETYDSLSVTAIKVGDLITGTVAGTALESKNTIVKNTLYRAQLTAQPSWIPDDIPMTNMIRYIIKIEYPWTNSPADMLIILDESMSMIGFNAKQPGSDWGVWFYKGVNGLTIKVPVSQNTITLASALETAYYWGNTCVQLEDGDYTINSFDGLGMTIGNDVKLLGTSKTRIIAQSPSGLQYFSILYAGKGNFIVDNIKFIGSNIRYCIHDDPQSPDNGIPATHIFRNCEFYIDNDLNNVWPNNQCIGGGMGMCTTVIIDNCTFEASTPSASLGLASYHNNGSADAQGKIIIKDSLFKGDDGTCRASWYGVSTKITEVYVSGCKMGIPVIFSAETGDSTVQNMHLNEWGNVIGNGAATNSIIGGFKTGYTSSGANVAVQLDANNKAFVAVPNNASAQGGNDLTLVTTGDRYNWDVRCGATLINTATDLNTLIASDEFPHYWRGDNTSDLTHVPTLAQSIPWSLESIIIGSNINFQKQTLTVYSETGDVVYVREKYTTGVGTFGWGSWVQLPTNAQIEQLSNANNIASDLDDITETCVCMAGSSTANKPIAWAIVQTIVYSSTLMIQIAFGTGSDKMYYRRKDTTWQAWKEVAFV